jgi:hypothetical protein
VRSERLQISVNVRPQIGDPGVDCHPHKHVSFMVTLAEGQSQ